MNQARNSEEGFDTYKRINDACAKFIGVEANWLGYLGVCRDFRHAIKTRTPPVIGRPKSPFTRSVQKTASRLSRWLLDENAPTRMDKSPGIVKNALSELEHMESVVQ